MALRSGPVTVEVPATSANLGPGYDALGLSLSLHDVLVAEVREPSGPEPALVVEVEGEGAGTVPRDERHLVVRAMRTAFAAAGEQPAGLRLRCRNVLPHGRGLGSSSAAIVGGLVLARGLLDDPARLDDQRLLDLATRLEGHPDNVAPAMLGGFVVCGLDPARGEGAAYAVPSPVAPGVAAVVAVPSFEVATETARGLLPAVVPHADAALNAGRAALLTLALTRRPDLLLPATEDRLHQRYREPAMPPTLALVDSLRSAGVPAVVSGAGPTVLAFVGEAVGVAADEVRASCPDGWSVHEVEVGGPGARVTA